MKNPFKYDTSKISQEYTVLCYHYTFEDFLREYYNISISTFNKYRRIQDKLRRG